MFEKLAEKVRVAVANAAPQPFDPEVFQDPVATATKWTPASTSGTNMRSHRLVEDSADRLVYRPAASVKVFCGIFFFLGLACSLAFALGVAQDSEGMGFPEVLLPIGFGGLFMAVGAGMYWGFSSPRVFDRRRGLYWKGRKSPDEVMNLAEIKGLTDLRQVHALQVLRRWVRGNKRSYWTYELNLVLKDASRTHVLVSGHGPSLREEAERLGQFLSVPVWVADRSA